MHGVLNPLALHAGNPGPMTGSGNNTYLIADAGEAVLIDAGVGHPDHLASLQRAVIEARASLHTLVVTHGHTDHAAGAPAVVEQHRPVICRKFVLEREVGDVAWEPLHDGDRVRVGAEVLTVVHTPGHAPDHLVLWHEESRSAFSGDLVIPGRSVVVDVARGGRMRDYLASLQRLLELEPRQLFPAHGPLVENPQQVIAGHIAHRLERERQVLAAVAAGLRSVEAIADSIYDRLDPRLLAAARDNVRAHLDKLKAEGKAADHDGGWTLRT